MACAHHSARGWWWSLMELLFKVLSSLRPSEFLCFFSGKKRSLLGKNQNTETRNHYCCCQSDGYKPRHGGLYLLNTIHKLTWPVYTLCWRFRSDFQSVGQDVDGKVLVAVSCCFVPKPGTRAGRNAQSSEERPNALCAEKCSFSNTRP